MILRIIQPNPKTRTFTRLERGTDLRKALNLDKFDTTQFHYILESPEDTVAITTSFYKGLFKDSLKTLGGVQPFLEKYTLVLPPPLAKDLKQELELILKRSI